MVKMGLCSICALEQLEILREENGFESLKLLNSKHPPHT